jgi:hypothetical protein
MGWLTFIPIIGKVVEKIIGVVDEAVVDKDKAKELKAKIRMAAMAMDHQEIETLVKAQADIVKAEVQGQSWLQRNWRPLLMMVVIAIIFNNYVLVPYLIMFTDKIAVLELPTGLWALLTAGVSGYVVGRSGEKIASKLKDK